MTKIPARFVTSAAQPSDFPPATLPEVAVVGRSNVGKSTLINALVGQPGLARTSRTPGRTRLVNWFAIGKRSAAAGGGDPERSGADAGPLGSVTRGGTAGGAGVLPRGIEERFYLVDLPGYGYAEVSQATRESWRPLIERYLAERTSLAGVLLLIDVRRGAKDEELDFLPWLAERETPVVVALTKADKLPKHKRALEVARARQALALRRDPIAVSATDGDGIDPLWRAVVQLATRPKPGPKP